MSCNVCEEGGEESRASTGMRVLQSGVGFGLEAITIREGIVVMKRHLYCTRVVRSMGYKIDALPPGTAGLRVPP